MSDSKRVVLITVLFSFGLLLCSRFSATHKVSAQEKKTPATSQGKPLQLPWQEEPLQPLQEIKSRTLETQIQIDATAWYMTGQLLQGRNDFRGAFDAYKKAIRTDPEMIVAYRSAVPLAFSLNQTEAGVEFAKKAIKLDPNDYRILRQLGVFMITRQDVPQATQFLSQAVKSSRLDKNSVEHILLQRDLGVIYKLTNQKKQAADAYLVIFDALQNPEKFHLNNRARSILNGDPRTSYQTVGEAFLDDKRYDIAVLAFEKAAKTPRGKPALLSYNLAQVYHATGKNKKGLVELQKYFDAKLSSKGKGAYDLFENILKALGQQKEFLAKIEALVKADSKNVPLKHYLANMYFDANRLDDAEKEYLKVLSLENDASGHLGLVKIYRLKKKPEQLLKALSNVSSTSTLQKERDKELVLISEQKDLVKQLTALGEQWAAGDEPKLKYSHAYLLAKITAEAGETEPTVKFYRFALKARPAQATTIFDELGSYFLYSQKYAESIKIFEEAINTPAIAGAKANFLFRISQAYEFNGDTEKALSSIRDAQKLIPSVPLLHYQEAWIFYHSKQHDKAIKLFEQVMVKFPTNKVIVKRCRSSLSNLYVQQGHLDKGIEILEKVYRANPDDPGVNNDLGYLYADHDRNLDKAEAMIRKAVTAEPNNSAYLDSMGWVLYKQGKYKEALPYLQKATKKPTGGDSTLFEHLGDILIKLNQKEKAKKAFQTALDDAKKSKPLDPKQIKKLKAKLK